MRTVALLAGFLAVFLGGLAFAGASTSSARPCNRGHPCPTTTPTTTTVPTTTAPNPDPSGQPMPVGDLPGWRQIFADDFRQMVPLGSFPDAVATRWSAYPYPWPGTPTWGTYDPHRTTSFHDGVQDIWLHTVNGEHLIAANQPKVNGDTPDSGLGRLYGRYVVRFRTDRFADYHASWLLWPMSETWPRDGEIDFPEGDFDGNVYAFMHRQGGTSGGDQDAYATSTPIAGAWHTATIEWLPSRVTFLLDGLLVGQSTSRIPNTPMRYVIQNGGSFCCGVAPDAAQGHILIDWVAVYAALAS